MRTKLCSLRKHQWKPLRGGKREQCIICKTVFPCDSKKCGHIDCYEATGEMSRLPSWVTPSPEVEDGSDPADA